MRRRLLISGLLATLVAMLSLVAVTPAGAATGTYLRLAHLSPDTPAMDVSVTSFGGQTMRLTGVGYGDVSTYRQIEPGSYTVQMRLAGAPESSPAVVSGTLQATAGSSYTAAGLGPRAGLAVRILSDDLTPPGTNEARVRVVQGAEQAGAAAITWNRAPIVDAVDFGAATDYVTVPSGAGTFEVAPTSGAALQVPVDLAAGGIYSVIVVQRDGALAAEVKTDARGPGSTPTGGVETGLGGTSAPSGPPVWLLVPVALLLVAAAGRTFLRARL